MYAARSTSTLAQATRRSDPDEARDATRELPRGDAPLGTLLQSLRPRLVALALRFTRDADAADDVVQNAFEKAIRHRRQFRGQARVSTWLHRIVTNEALMWLRAQRRRDLRVGALADVDVELLVDPAPDPLQDLDLRRAALRLREGIAELAPDERHVIERCVLPGRSYGEYGAESGLHPAAAKTRAFRARRRLHARLAES